MEDFEEQERLRGLIREYAEAKSEYDLYRVVEDDAVRNRQNYIRLIKAEYDLISEADLQGNNG